MRKRKIFWVAQGCFFLFLFWTGLVLKMDVQAIGPLGTSVGLATFNGIVHRGTGVNMWLYTLTDWMGLVPIAVAFGFGLLGISQWIRRKKIERVDYNILALGVFYTTVIAFYLFFELFVVNYRPILINGNLEASYPSSTTFLVLCVMPTAMMQWHARLGRGVIKCGVLLAALLFTLFMVAARIISGVHWASDVVGGVLLSMWLVMTYYAAVLSRH